MSIALILSYALDWIIIFVVVIVGGLFSVISPNKRPFALNNTQISYPYQNNEKITAYELGAIGCIAPAIIIFAITILLVPGPTVPKSTPKSLIWRRKLWEWHTSWLGLALALASSFIITQGMKNLFGKPRPDLLSRCDPDLQNKAQFQIGGFAQIDPAFLLYSAAICRQTDHAKLDDGFRSFPSGHSSFSAAGLIYLSLFIASKLGTTIPFLPSSDYAWDASRFAAFPSRMPKKSKGANAHTNRSSSPDSFEDEETDSKIVAARNQAAAPPIYLLVLTIIPWFASIYISATRFSDFRHHGFDILFGYIIGTITAIFAFRYYHLPLSQGAGWSWGPRSKDRSFWAGVGVGNYVGKSNTQSQRDLRDSMEQRHRHSTSMVDHDLENGHPFERPQSQEDNIELLSMRRHQQQKQDDPFADSQLAHIEEPHER